jgi:predicted MFS family arabinose efflux permease
VADVDLGRNLLGSPVNPALSALAGIYLQIVQSAPVAVDAITSKFGLTPVEIGVFCLVLFGTISLVNILCALATSRIPWALAALTGSITMVLGNALAALASDFNHLLAWCSVGAIGSGVMASIGASAIGVGRRPERNFGIMFAALALFAVVALFLVPFGLDVVGWRIIFIIFSAAALPGLLISLWLPKDAPDAHIGRPRQASLGERWKSSPLTSGSVVLGELGVFLIYMALTSVFTYVGQIASFAGLESGRVGFAISGSFVFCFLGSTASAYLPGLRKSTGVYAGAAIVITSLILFHHLPRGAGSEIEFCLSLALFMFGWNFGQTFLFAATAGVDATGAASSMASGLSSVAGAVSPICIAPIVVMFGLISVPVTAAILIFFGVLAVTPMSRTGRSENESRS